MRRFLGAALAAVLILGSLAGCAKPAQPPKDAKPAEEPAAGATVTIHYHRYAGDYEPWDLWVWAEGKNGAGHKFTEKTDYGVKAVVTLPEAAERVGFIVRKGGDSWTAKDIGVVHATGTKTTVSHILTDRRIIALRLQLRWD